MSHPELAGKVYTGETIGYPDALSSTEEERQDRREETRLALKGFSKAVYGVSTALSKTSNALTLSTAKRIPFIFGDSGDKKPAFFKAYASFTKEGTASSKDRFTGTVRRLEDQRCICLMDLHGLQVEVSFPLEVIKNNNLKEMDEFEWVVSDSGEIQPEDCKPLHKETMRTQDQEKKLQAFLNKALPRHKRKSNQP